MASTSRTRICDLPNEVMIFIFSHLPVADMASCAATCERWREVVTGFTNLWKGKEYRSNRSPTECPETRAVIHALPPFQEVVVEPDYGFRVEISYPRIVLYFIDWSVWKDFPRLRCKRLSTSTDIAGDFLSHRSVIDFEGLRHLQILGTVPPNFLTLRDYSAEYVIRTALSLCPSLEHLNVNAVSAEHLDSVEEIGRLQRLGISCPGLKNLSFLRHCSEALEELRLVGFIGLPSREFTELRQLRNLRRLRLSDCVFEQEDVAAAAEGLGNLESLHLCCCSLISDLSILQRCGRLRELRITKSYVPDSEQTVMPDGHQVQLHDLQLPTYTDFRIVRVVGVSLTAGDLSAALTRLEELGLTSRCLAYLRALRHCSQLRRLCCEFVRQHDEPELFNVRVHVTLPGST